MTNLITKNLHNSISVFEFDFTQTILPATIIYYNNQYRVLMEVFSNLVRPSYIYSPSSSFDAYRAQVVESFEITPGIHIDSLT